MHVRSEETDNARVARQPDATRRVPHRASTAPRATGERIEPAPPASPIRLARLVYEYFVFYLGYLYFGTGCALASVVFTVLHPLIPARFGARLGRSLTGLHFRGLLALLRASGLVRIDLAALDDLRGKRSIVIAPNHPSLLDAVFIISRLPQVACIMKAGIWDSFFLGGGARLSRYIRNDSAVNMVRLSTKELREGHQLLIFPEGTRTRCPPVNAFKGGFALMAKKSGADIQTIFIETNSTFLNKDWPMLKKPAFPLVYRARLGKRFRVTGDVTEFVSALENYYRQELGTPAIREQDQPASPGSASRHD